MIEDKDIKVRAIDALRTVLGTMVIIPIEDTDPNTFKKVSLGSVQRPIIEGEDRNIVKNKLIELIKSI